jgi:1-acyl-sn-glycerol-3-phosphate acyltransferase
MLFCGEKGPPLSLLSPVLSTVARACQELVWRSAVSLYFNRVAVVHPERLPRSGATLFIGLHRNGAVDGFVYHRVVPRAVFMISTQLRRSALGRLFFTGIEVVRDKDRDGSAAERARNQAALEGCLALVRAGGELFVLPEGTSDLGPRHLPFKRGAAHIAEACLARGLPLQIVPLGIHYERAWAFRSNVEVVVGEPVDAQLPEGSEAERSAILHERFTRALEAVGFNVDSAAEQERAEKLAYAATLGTGHGYFRALKTFERGVPAPVAEALARLEGKCANLQLLRHQGVPLVPIASAWLYLLALLVLGPVVLGALLLNLPPLVISMAASAKMADARNVVALWRILVGLPALWLWAIAVALAAFAVGAPWLFVFYAGVSLLGVAAFYRTAKLAISLYNTIHGRSIRGELLELHRRLDAAVSHAP